MCELCIEDGHCSSTKKGSRQILLAVKFCYVVAVCEVYYHRCGFGRAVPGVIN